MDKNKLALPVTILLMSIILGGIYYIVETNKLQSIEKQQMIKIEEERKIEKEKSERDKSIEETKANQQKQENDNNNILIENCLNTAKYELERKKASAMDFTNEECISKKETTQSECIRAFLEALNRYENEEKQARDECYKKYPQK